MSDRYRVLMSNDPERMFPVQIIDTKIGQPIEAYSRNALNAVYKRCDELNSEVSDENS